MGIFIEFSVPKYEKGNNVEMIYPHNLLTIMEKLYTEICSHMNYQLPPLSEWIIYRLDVCYNWMLKDEDEALHAIDFIKRIDYPRKQKYVWDTSVMYKGTSYSIKFYLKGSEYKAHDGKVLDSKISDLLQPWADRILRFEVNLRRVYLQEFFLKERVYLADVTDDDTILEILGFYLREKVFKYLTIKTTTNAEVKGTLLENFTKQKATKLYQFYKSYYLDDDVKDMLTRGGLDRSTIYRYKRDLKLLGIGLSSDGESSRKGILEKLVIPSPDSSFDLLDRK